MIGENEDVKAWKENLFNAIKNVSDIEFQKKAWLGQIPGVVFSFDETCCTLYDDFDFKRFIKYYKLTVGEDYLYQLFLELDQLFNSYRPSMKDKLILKDPQWEIITDKANEVVQHWV